MNAYLPAVESLAHRPTGYTHQAFMPGLAQQGFPLGTLTTGPQSTVNAQTQQALQNYVRATTSYPVLSGLLDSSCPPASEGASNLLYTSTGATLTPLKNMSPVYHPPPMHTDMTHHQVNPMLPLSMADIHRSAFRPVFPRTVYEMGMPAQPPAQTLPQRHTGVPLPPQGLQPDRTANYPFTNIRMKQQYNMKPNEGHEMPLVNGQNSFVYAPPRDQGGSALSPRKTAHGDHNGSSDSSKLLQLVTHHLMSESHRAGRSSVHSSSSGSEKEFESPESARSEDQPLDFSTRSSPGKESKSKGSTAFDGTTVLCQVCGDKASGFHYGVHACEGCKGFFRRSIQQKIQYRPCTKDQQCSVLRINRNRCQYCRLKKCIAVGMSRDAVRFGRVPKIVREKMKVEMQKANAASQVINLASELENEEHLINSIISAHLKTSEVTREHFMRDIDATGPPVSTACPLSPANGSMTERPYQVWQEFSRRYSPTIEGVVDFAKLIPGFHVLPLEDQVTLLKAAVFEVLLLRLSPLFDPSSRSMRLLNGSVYHRDSSDCSGQPRFLVDSLFDFIDRLHALRLTDSDIALFSAVVLICPDRPGLRSQELVVSMHRRLVELLQVVMSQTHPNQPNAYQLLLQKVPDLRTLNTLHTEKLLAFKMEPKDKASSEKEATSAGMMSPRKQTEKDTIKTEKEAGQSSQPVHHHSPGKNSFTDSGKGSLSISDSLSDHHHSSDSEIGGASPSSSPRQTGTISKDLPALKRALNAPPTPTLNRIDLAYGPVGPSTHPSISPAVPNEWKKISGHGYVQCPVSVSNLVAPSIREKYSAVASLLESQSDQDRSLSILASTAAHHPHISPIQPLRPGGNSPSMRGSTLGKHPPSAPCQSVQEEPLNLSKKACLRNDPGTSPNSLTDTVLRCSISYNGT